MILRKLVRKKKFYETDFWKDTQPIRWGILFLFSGLFSYIESKMSNYELANYWGGNILPLSMVAILAGIIFIIGGIIKKIKNKKRR
ncbi:MAG: hypothetical protein AABX99_02330 [Nanoarchaeota archaeon]